MSTAKITAVADINLTNLCLRVPMYEVMKFGRAEYPHFLNQVVNILGHFDTHCIYCKKPSTFHKLVNHTTPDGETEWHFVLELACARNKRHLIAFDFVLHFNGSIYTLQKVGQFPALADLAQSHLEKYRSPLGDERFRELHRAVGLISHGVGVGAFVYLRRILEHLIEEAHQTAKLDARWSEPTEFQSMRVGEKIEVLRDFLPPFFVENRSLYGILSKGVHSLTEQECIHAFPAVLIAIELILDQKLEAFQRAEKLKEAQKSLAALRDNLS